MYFHFRYVKVIVFKILHWCDEKCTHFPGFHHTLPIEQCLHKEGVHSVNICFFMTTMFTTPGNALIIHVFM